MKREKHKWVITTGTEATGWLTRDDPDSPYERFIKDDEFHFGPRKKKQTLIISARLKSCYRIFA